MITFELSRYTKQWWFYAVLAAVFAFGIVVSSLSIMSRLGMSKYGTFATALMLGFMSLFAILFTTLTAAQTLLREHDARFSMILYSTPITTTQYLTSRFLTVFAVSLLCMTTLAAGFVAGRITHPETQALMSLLGIVQPLLLFIVPNTLFCTALLCAVAWLTRKRLNIYVAGLLLYIGYMVTMLFSGSPLLARNMPQSLETMRLSAVLDPFGLSALFHQTLTWSIAERNTELLHFTGTLLVNRLLYAGISIGGLAAMFVWFRFSIKEPQGARKQQSIANGNKAPQARLYQPFKTSTHSALYHIASFWSSVRLDIQFVFKSIPFLLIMIGLGFYLSMEIYGAIDKGIRMPERFATTALMVNEILSNFPLLCLPVILFYSNELLWRSRAARMDAIEGASPVFPVIQLLAKWLVLGIIAAALTLWMICVGIAFQLGYGYPHIDWGAYLSLFWMASAPLVLSAGVAIAVQHRIPNKYAALIFASCAVVLSATNVIRLFGANQPLLRFTAAFGGTLSEMNGWDDYVRVFGIRMMFGAALTLLVFALSLYRTRPQPRYIVLLSVLLLGALGTGTYLHNHLVIPDEEKALSKQALYEQQYRRFQAIPQPVITDVRADIALYPERGEYHVSGTYMLRNTSNQAISEVLVGFFDDAAAFGGEIILKGRKYAVNEKNVVINLQTPLQHLDSAMFAFHFSYTWNGFKRHQPLNAIVRNGAFMRISRFFPQFGYQAGNEIEDEQERSKRNFGKATPLLVLEDARTRNAFVNLTMQISTAPDQIPVGVGDKIKEWRGVDTNGQQRNFVLYQTPASAPIPFRFGVASARYAVVAARHGSTDIEILYHPQHHENVPHLLVNAKRTLEYCEKNFGAYPFSQVRFAEVSAFTRGFMATAYPATIFMAENIAFHANLRGDARQDVINELAGHELAHEWWGTAVISPDDREGAAMLTETLAMYTELMLLKSMYGEERALKHVQMHHQIYLSDRGFVPEQALWRTQLENAHQHYSKGLVVMYHLYKRLGEERVNAALRSFLQKHRYAAATLMTTAPITTDLLTEFYAVSPPEMHTAIDDAFKQIITHKFSIGEASAQKIQTNIGQEYELQYEISAEKFLEDGAGKLSNTRFQDSVEIGITNQEGKMQYRTVWVDSVRKASLRVPYKPLEIELDPHLLFIRTNTEPVRQSLR
jgi:ABC-2 type transport system permease protein